MSLYKLLYKDSSYLVFELLAAAGLVLNALVVSSQAPLSGAYLHAASTLMFGVGVLGVAVIYALPHVREQDLFREVVAIYGGLIIASVTSSFFAFLVAIGEFNNLLAILMLSGFGFFYFLLWSRIPTWERSDLWLHS